MNEVGGITGAFKANASNAALENATIALGNEEEVYAQLTITVKYQLLRSNYRYNPETDSNRTDEELAALTYEQMMAQEMQMLIDGEYDLDELVTNADPNLEKDVMWKLVEDDGSK
jgi:hypothetical protein